MMLGLYSPTDGPLLYNDAPVTNTKIHWREVQAVFQDPFSEEWRVESTILRISEC